MRRLLGLVLILAPGIIFAQSAVNGSWRIDASQAKMDSKPSVYELNNGVFRCSTCDPKLAIKADGTDQKIENSPYVDSEKVTVKDDHNVEQIGMKDGKMVFHTLWTVSPDGKTLTEKFEDHPMSSGQAVTGSTIYSRVGEAPAGAHPISGAWQVNHFEGISDNALTFNYQFTGDGLNYKASTGESYSAKFDGKDYPYHGDPGTSSVSLKRINDHSFEETYKRNGEVTGTETLTISPDGKSLTIEAHDARRGMDNSFVASKTDGSAMADK